MSTESQASLPFEPNLDSLSVWLDTLSLNERERFSSLYAGLLALNTATPEPVFYFQALEKIRTPVFKASAALASAFVGKPFPLEAGVRKLAKLSVQFQAELAHGYYTLAVGGDFRLFDPQQQGRIVHNALRSYGQMLLGFALMYEAPSSVVWRRLGEVYCLAEREGLPHWAQACSEFPQSAPCSVEQLYLRLLAFCLAGPYRLTQTEIPFVFSLMQRHGHLIRLGQNLYEEGRKAEFAVDFDSKNLPASVSREDGGGKPGLRYLFMEPLRRMLEVEGRPPLNKESGLSTELSDYLRIRFGGSLEFLSDKRGLGSILVTGYKRLTDAMGYFDAKVETGESLRDFKLMPLDEHLSPVSRLELSKTSGTFGATASEKKTFLEEQTSGIGLAGGLSCRVYPSSMPGFYLIEAPGVDLRGKSLLGIFTDDKLIQIGLLCPGRNDRAQNASGFQLLASPVSLVRLSFDASPRKVYTGFFSPMVGGVFSLIVEPMRLRSGDGLGIGHKWRQGGLERYKISRLLEKTAEFCQYEVVPEPQDFEL